MVLSFVGKFIKSFSRKQTVVALSSAEAELSALVETAKKVLFAELLRQSFVESLSEDEKSSHKIRIDTDSIYERKRLLKQGAK